MAFGNKLGVTISDDVTKEELSGNCVGSLVAEVSGSDIKAIAEAMAVAGLADDFAVVGQVNNEGCFKYQNMSLSMEAALADWTKPLEKVFPTRATADTSLVDTDVYEAKEIYI